MAKKSKIFGFVLILTSILSLSVEMLVKVNCNACGRNIIIFATGYMEKF